MNSDKYDIGYKKKSLLDNEIYEIFISPYGKKYWERVSNIKKKTSKYKDWHSRGIMVTNKFTNKEHFFYEYYIKSNKLNITTLDDAWEHYITKGKLNNIQIYKTPPLPKELTSAYSVYIGDKYKYLALKYKDKIKHAFDNNIDCTINKFCKSINCTKQIDWSKTEKYNGSMYKSPWKPITDGKYFSLDDYKMLEKEYNAQIWEFKIMRNIPCDILSNRGDTQYPNTEHWSSELWHYDNHDCNNFKIIIYLNNVTLENGPFEYKESIEYHPYAGNRELYTRLGLKDIGKKVVGNCGTTIIFKEQISHKGNYARTGYRDIISFRLRINDSFMFF